MKIAVIGSGNVGGSLAQQWVKAGHTVLIGAKFPLSEKTSNSPPKSAKTDSHPSNLPYNNARWY